MGAVDHCDSLLRYLAIWPTFTGVLEIPMTLQVNERNKTLDEVRRH